MAGWPKEDRQFYREAITLRHHNKGIAALPYLRRIIEAHVADILRMLQLAANQSGQIADAASFQNAVSSGQFRERLDLIKEHLPSNLLLPGRPNPIEALYGLLSQGLHNQSEEECIDIFDECRAAFEYVVKRLAEEKRSVDEYAANLQRLQKKANKKD